MQLRAAPVEAIFLDIDMLGFSGLELLRTLAQPPAIVLCTAHAARALEGFELGVADYLLKPVRFERFVKTINRLQDLRPVAAPLVAPAPEAAWPSRSKPTRAPSAFGWLKCHLAGGRVLLTAETIKQMEAQLPPPHFVRVHK